MTRKSEQTMNEERCPKCHHRKLKSWNELGFEERMIVERLPLSAEISLAKRKRHRFCTRCWFEFIEGEDQRA
jgi:DNA-directed RNA polymerase subunit RPC12/RpoP